VWEGGIRVPCVAWWPQRVAAGATIDSPAWTVDLRATVGALADAPTPPSDGRDLTALLLDGDPMPTRALYWPFPGYGGQEAVREGDWKIVRTGLRQRKTAAADLEGWQLFNLAEDPNETADVAATHPDIVARLAGIASDSYEPSERFPLR
jgi:arylsulfatase A